MLRVQRSRQKIFQRDLSSIQILLTMFARQGGMKAVVWTNVLQIIFMFSGLVVIIIKGAIDHGGLSALWMDMYDGDRIEFF
jgi:Na+/proline symporter